MADQVPIRTERLDGAQRATVRLERSLLVVLTGPEAGRKIPLDAPAVVLGAASDCGARLIGRGISKRHARLECAGGRALLRDLESTNGTLLNSSAIREAYLKPGDLITLGDVTLRFEERTEEVRVAPSDRDRFGELFGTSPPMRQLFGILERAAATESNILVLGESGTGKDLVARAVHRASPRAKGPLVVVDCSVQNAELLASEMFGHVEGAFTGAHRRRQGAFESANRGTIFLDEIGELPLDLQPKFLRALENREVRPVGANAPVPVDVRVVAATHRDLPAMVKGGRFREDLYYRLAVVQVWLPPLRERREDIPGLVAALVPSLKGVRRDAPFSRDALEVLAAQPWRGNVRELRNVLERTLALCPDGEVGVRDLLITSRDTAPAAPPPERTAGPAAEELAGRTLDEIERAVIQLTLRRTRGNQSETARILGLHRNGLAKKMKRHRLSPSGDDAPG